MLKKVSEKLGVKEGMRSLFVNADADAINAMQHPNLDVKIKLVGDFDYIHFFVVTSKEFHKTFPKLAQHIKENGSIWVSWPKSGQNGTDLNLITVIKLGYDYGMVESKSISINDVWSALKFTKPKKGKIYNNSYGKLKDADR